MNIAGSPFTIGSHFENRDDNVRRIYERLLSSAQRFGRVVEEPKKTSIHLVNATAFAGIATRKSSLNLTLKSDRQLTSPRIHKSERVSANRYHHELKLTSPAEVDAELKGWLKLAYSLSE
jgi:Domain of unknown function (DUF5655)